jgi:hypothetical protein
MSLIFASAMFFSAVLLFLVEPMFAKMALPLLGGTAAVWNTCMVFFQAGLLAGYAFAHGVTERLSTRGRTILQLALLLLPLLVLPIHIRAGWTPPGGQNPIPWLLAILLVSVGLPFFMLATITPTLQAWFANTGHPYAKDPYFLYAASNLGSMLGLLSYPLLIEPHLRLADQSRLWTFGYGALVALVLGCAVIVWRWPSAPRDTHGPGESHNPAGESSAADSAARPSTATRARWVVLSFVPSSLMLGVTTTLTTDVPPIPLFWIAPLAVYLVTFILVFAQKPRVSHEQMIEKLPLLVLASLIPIVTKAQFPVFLLIALDLLTLFVAAMVCHGELAKSRPASRYLTEFYLWMALGGVLGGLFNGILAPLIFSWVLEFPLVLVLAALLRPSAQLTQEQQPRARLLDFALPVALGALAVGLIWACEAMGAKPGPVLHLMVFAPAMLLCLSFAKRPVRFAVGVAVLLAASLLYTGPYGHVLETKRSFFGVYRVTVDREKKFRVFFHGSTIHGLQHLDPSQRLEPLSYFTRIGPVGQLFTAFSGSGLLQRVAVVGLGAGSMACYGQPGQQFTYYEIDSAVERIARDPRYFTFLRDCSPKIDVILGDARLSLQNATDHQYGLLVLDAFSGDALPVHLVTREAMLLYLSKLSPNGVLVFNITNRFLNLGPVLGNLARDAGLVGLVQDDSNVSEAEQAGGRYPSRWVVMARTESDLGSLAHDSRWTVLPDRPDMPVWTDDFSNILSVITWD